MRPSGRRSSRPAHLRSTASTGQSTAFVDRWRWRRRSPPARRAGVDRGLVEQADPDAVVALALEIEAFVEVGDERQVPKAAPPRTRSCCTVRRFGTRPMPVTPARVAAPARPRRRRRDEIARPPCRRWSRRSASIGLPRAQQFGIGPHDAARPGALRPSRRCRPPPRCRRRSFIPKRRSLRRAGHQPVQRRPVEMDGANSPAMSPSSEPWRRHGSNEPPRVRSEALLPGQLGRRTAAWRPGSGAARACRRRTRLPEGRRPRPMWRPHKSSASMIRTAPVYD